MSTTFLDNTEKIAALDVSHTLESAHLLPDQIRDIWQQAQSVPTLSQPLSHIVVSGMGGSALGAHVVLSVFKHELPVPLTIVNGYDLPAFVNANTLVICSSYSGSTEETISSLNQAITKKAAVMVMATGGDLISIAQAHQLPHLQFVANHNPSNQPRMAIGYMVMGLLTMLSKTGMLPIPDDQVAGIIEHLQNRRSTFQTDTAQNQAKQLAYELFDKIVFLVSADHLTGAFHVINNQINENAKQITVELNLPELNHHYMEALTFPKFVPNQGVFLFADSSLYHPRNRIRVSLTKKVVEQAGFTSTQITLSTGDRLMQAFETIQLGMYTNLYLAFLNGLNPAPIPVVDYFKHELSKAG